MAMNESLRESIISKEKEIEALKKQLSDHVALNQNHIENFNKINVQILFE